MCCWVLRGDRRFTTPYTQMTALKLHNCKTHTSIPPDPRGEYWPAGVHRTIYAHLAACAELRDYVRPSYRARCPTFKNSPPFHGPRLRGDQAALKQRRSLHTVLKDILTQRSGRGGVCDKSAPPHLYQLPLPRRYILSTQNIRDLSKRGSLPR